MKKLLLILLLIASTTLYAQSPVTGNYKKVLVIAAHPDDPETMCGGTVLKLIEQGCEVINVYLTSGERGIPGKSLEEAAAIRRIEAKNASDVLGVKAEFLTQIDGDAQINKERYDEMKAIIAKYNPDMVITHWPIDSHRDHRVCSVLVYDAWRQLDHSFDLFYGEVMSGLQTQMFSPTVYVNIDSTYEKKREAYLQHVSQFTDGSIETYHNDMEKLRGHEFHCKRAEAFIRHFWDK